MTPAARRLRYIIDDCRANHPCPRMTFKDMAAILGVAPITFRRWLSGERPVPRAVALLFEIHHRWPEINRTSLKPVLDGMDDREKGT